jgi:ABC-type transport system substrate-binding protein
LSAAQIAANPNIDPGHYKNVVVYSKTDETPRYIDLTTGAVQIAALRSSVFQLILKQPGYAVAQLPHSALVGWVVMNNKLFPTNITLVRQAIVHAINYSQVIQAATLGYGTPYFGPETPFFSKYYNPGNIKPYQMNLTLAAQELAKAGFPNGTGLPTITFTVDEAGQAWQEPAAVVIAANLQAIGININIQVVSNNLFYTNYGNYAYNLAHAQQIWQMSFDDPTIWAPDYMAPTDYWSYFVTTFSNYGNYGIYNNTIVDQDVAYMFSHSDITGVQQHLADAEQRIYNDAPYAWLFQDPLPLVQGSYAYKTSIIQGFYLEPNLQGGSDIPLFNTVLPASG